MSSSTLPSPAPRSPIVRVVGASLVGTTVEWYDFFLYGAAAALVFPELFFPNSDPLTGTLLSFLTYAVGFVARPLGGVYLILGSLLTIASVALYAETRSRDLGADDAVEARLEAGHRA